MLVRLLIPLLLFTVLTGCNGQASHSYHQRKLEVTHRHKGGEPIRAVCTTGMIADLVRTVGGKNVTVEQLFGSDVDPHQYKATPEDVGRLNNAKAIFYNGLHLEGKMTDLFERLGRKLPAFPVGEYLDANKILVDGGSPDPHIWFDVALWSDAAGVVRDALSLFDPDHADDYKANADRYQKELAALHDDARAKIAAIPKGRRVLVTSHDAFRYFGRAYDIEVKGIQGISTESEASVRDINQLVGFISERQVKAVFVESTVSDRNMKALRSGCEKRGHEVVIGGQLFSDAMGEAGTPQGTYVGMIRHNVETIVKALQ